MPDPKEAARPTPFRADDLERYMLHGHRQIRQLLQDLIDGHALITAYPGGGGNSFVTALIRLSDDERTLVLDASPDAAVNAHVLATDRLVCVTQLDKIRIQFSLGSVAQSQDDGRGAFEAPVPEKMLRLQRREFFRLQVPLLHEVVCAIQARAANGQPARVEARVIDISAGGVAVHLAPEAAEFVIGATIDDCTLALPDIEPMALKLEVRNITRHTQRSGTEALRIGFRFTDLPRSADAKIQRYIFNTERERNARERGGI